MLSLQSGPHGSGLRQQVEAVSREAEDEGGVVVSTNQLSQVAEDVDEVMGQVEYHLEYCLDKFPMTYKTQVLYPALGGVFVSFREVLGVCIL